MQSIDIISGKHSARRASCGDCTPEPFHHWLPMSQRTGKTSFRSRKGATNKPSCLVIIFIKLSILYEKKFSQCFILPFDDSNRFHQRSILFAFYGVCQKFVANVAGVSKVENLSTFQNGTSGFLAAFFSSLALCPTELVKCRFVIPQYMLFHPCRSWGLNKIITR